jgi:hypothetical protein
VLLQNAHLDVFEDELAALGEDEGPATAAGRPETTLSELQSFVDLSYSHGRAVTRLQWLPQRRVCLLSICIAACSCTCSEAASDTATTKPLTNQCGSLLTCREPLRQHAPRQSPRLGGTACWSGALRT